MIQYKITIDNRNYDSWTIYNATTLEIVMFDNFNPAKHKLFSNDVFTYENDIVTIIHSSLRLDKAIPAVLILADNKTYGRENKLVEGKSYTSKSAKSRQGRLLYKCIPDDNRMPIFLVPYEIKNLGFSKVLTNLYVTIHFTCWIDKHPKAMLTQTIGSVDILDNFYEYQLYCKSLNTSIQNFNKAANKSIHDNVINEIYSLYPQIIDRTHWKIFTIDPKGSLDFDDGFSIRKLNDNQTLLSIYIANVTIWMNSLNLWSSFSQRISTIYLPDRKRPMLPSILSDVLCSLQENVLRFAFVMDVILDSESNIVNISYCNALIKVFKNYRYEEDDLLKDTDYHYLLETTGAMTQRYKYITNIRNSHDVVCYLMIFMNYYCAKEFLKYNNGIFRTTIIKQPINIKQPIKNTLLDDVLLPDDVRKYIQIWNSISGQYVDLNVIPADSIEILTRHELLEIDAYIHITSPIRRLVDLLNMIKLQQNMGLIVLSDEATQFYEKWIKQLDYINITMRAIRKIQHECTLLATCFENPEILDKEYEGYCFDKLVRNDGLYQFIVYLPELKLTSKITIREDLGNYEKRIYKLFLFSDEEKFKKKIRLQFIR
jgi:exoribonuclease R